MATKWIQTALLAIALTLSGSVKAGRKIDENLVLPAELVSTEAPNQYLTIRIKVPENAMTAIKTVKPGEWVTVTSRHQPSTEEEAVVSVRPYGATTTTE